METIQIEKYGGFYIGRYEAGVSVLNKATGIFEDSVTFGEKSLNGKVESSINKYGWAGVNDDYVSRNSSITSLLGSTYGENKASGNIVVKADAIPYYHADYYTAKEMSKKLYINKTNVKSELVTGTQWDVMLKYMQDNGVAVTGTNCKWGNLDDVAIDEITGYYKEIDSSNNTDIDGFKDGSNFTTSNSTNSWVILTTGASEKVKKMNLYDVVGNLWEWTDEAAYSYNGSKTTATATADFNTYSIRGGAFNNNSSATIRVGQYAIYTTTIFGFRVALFIQ